MNFKRVLKPLLRKRFIIPAVITLLIIMGFSLSTASSKTTGYVMGKVTRTDLVEIVSETGTITTGSNVNLFSPTNGVVEKVKVKNGDFVKTGQELFVIKSTATEQEKSAALANYLAAKTSLDTANATLLKLQSAMFSNWQTFRDVAQNDTFENENGTPKYENRSLAEFHVNEKNWLAAESDYKKQQAVISQAQAGQSSAYLLYQATKTATIKATADGTISNLSVTVGSPASVNSSKPLAIIANFAITEVAVSLSESDATKIKAGQDAAITIKSTTANTYKALVDRVDSIGTEEKGVVHYAAYLRVLDADESIRPGMKVDVDIVTAEKKQVLAVPSSAVKPYQGGRAIRTLDQKGQMQYLPVQMGIRSKDNTEISSGVLENQDIIISLPNDKIKRSGMFGM